MCGQVGWDVVRRLIDDGFFKLGINCQGEVRSPRTDYNAMSEHGPSVSLELRNETAP